MDESQDRPVQREDLIYKRIKLLGSGSYGRAFLVEQILSGEKWAVKQVNLADLSSDEQQSSMKEAKILELLDHQNIVRFKQVYRTTKGKLNIVMEYAEGGDLSQRIRSAKETNQHFSQQQILNWFVQLCLGVKYIHDRKIIHRDIKPQNIFLTANNIVKIGDFGVARILENTVAKARTVVGSPYYLSPQIIENKPYSYKTDVWSLGTLLFEMCALHPPFTATNLQFLALKIVQGTYPQIPKQYSQGLRNLIKWMLQTKQSNRPTISQIFCSKIISSRMKNFLKQSQQLHERLPNTISNFNMSSLKPPPNLMKMEIAQNKSDIVSSKQDLKQECDPSPLHLKSKTPQIGLKKGANNFFNRPISGRRKQEAPNDLADLIQIKPSIIEMHEKYQKPLMPMIPLPKVVKLQPNPKSKIEAKQRDKMISPPNSAFVKKRISFAQLQGIKVQKKQLDKQVLHLGNQPKKIEPKKNKIEEKEKKKSNIKSVIRKKPSIKPVKIASQAKLQVCSQQAKKKMVSQRKTEKKVQKPKKQKNQKRPASQQIQQRIQIMQQQKCNSQLDLASNPSSYYDNYYDNYYEAQFDSYQECQSDQDELTYSRTLVKKKESENGYQKMLKEMEDINSIVQNNNGELQNLPILGQSIPQMLQFSTEVRQDDSEFESNIQTNVNNITNQNGQTPFVLQGGQLESLRMNLEMILGEQNIIFAYHCIQSKMNEEELNFNEEQTILDILSARKEIDEEALRNYFRLIVTIISVEKMIV